jgi:MoxR-like ATPase
MVAQNPFQDGSVNVLPDAMMDRLMIRIDMKFADEDAEKEMIRRDMRHEPNLSNILGSDELSGIQSLVNGVTLSEDIIEAIAKIVRRTRPDNPETEKSIAGLIHGHGVGPRGLQSLASMTKAFAVMSGRAVPNSHDLGRAVDLVLPHRIKLKAHMPEKQKEQMAMVMQSITRGFDLT